MSPTTLDRPMTETRDAKPSVLVTSHGLTSIGRVRTSNEDNFLIAELGRTLWVRQTSLPQQPTQIGRNRGHVLLVADGMGGHEAGEIASALTITTIESFLLHVLHRFSNLDAADEPGVAKELQEAIRLADDRIFKVTDDYPEFTGMGTTLTLAFISGCTLFVIHAGDSRCYLLRDGVLRQLTRDHTLVAELAREKVLSPEFIHDFKYRHVVTNVLGGAHEGVDVDVQMETLQPGDELLLCSDGLTDMLSPDRIADIVAGAADAEAACEQLIFAANEAGGEDNITAVVARIDELASDWR
jgi:protein phosphatase